MRLLRHLFARSSRSVYPEDSLRRIADAVHAAEEAARLRFRPIVMTSLAFILGCVPLAVSTGAGAASRHAIGTSVIGGMLVATLVAPLFVPFFFRWIMRASEKLMGTGKKEE